MPNQAFLRMSLASWRRKHAYRQRKLDIAHAKNDQESIAKWHTLLQKAGVIVRKREAQLDRLAPLRDRAYRVAAGLVGVMEHGGNNAGAMVTKIIKANGGTGPEAWCGDFVAYCYRLAGSRRVSRAWAQVSLMRGLAGITATNQPHRGDLVRFTFSHVGLFVRDLGNGAIETLEGNSGREGAVSDSSTGGDGVYRKRRSKALVRDYLQVHG
jgi:hypothetical protein